MPGYAGVVLAGGRSSRMGAPKAALEWHGSTLLRRTAGILARATGGPVVVVRARGQDLPGLPPDVEVVDDPREGQGPVQGLAAGLAAIADRPARPSSAPPTCRSCIPPSSGGCCARWPKAPTWACRWRGGTRSRWPPPTARRSRRSRSGSWRRRLRPAFLFEECVVSRLDEAALRDDPLLAALDPGLDSVVNLNEPEEYRTARSRPAPEVTVQRFGVLANGHRAPQAVRAATVAAGRGGRRRRVRRARDGGAQRGPDHQGRPDAAGHGGHGLLPVGRRGRLSQASRARCPPTSAESSAATASRPATATGSRRRLPS